MDLKEVKSSNISKVGYEDDNLYVQYNSGNLYRYKKVPKNVYKDLLESDSKGRYINSSVKSKYEYEKLK